MLVVGHVIAFFLHGQGDVEIVTHAENTVRKAHCAGAVKCVAIQAVMIGRSVFVSV